MTIALVVTAGFSNGLLIGTIGFVVTRGYTSAGLPSPGGQGLISCIDTSGQGLGSLIDETVQGLNSAITSSFGVLSCIDDSGQGLSSLIDDLGQGVESDI